MEPHDVQIRPADYLERPPSIAETVFVAPTASLMGAVVVGEYSSIWYQAVVRADIHFIQIGNRTNIQDGSILHVGDQYPLIIGNEVTCGHRAIVHACSIGDRVLIGMGAIFSMAQKLARIALSERRRSLPKDPKSFLDPW